MLTAREVTVMPAISVVAQGTPTLVKAEAKGVLGSCHALRRFEEGANSLAFDRI